MELEWYHYLLSITGGFAAGFINTLAGSGSLITLPILIFLGLPANIANGTNRIGILLQSFTGFMKMNNESKVSYKEFIKFIIPSVTGAIIGSLIVVKIEEQTLKIIIGILLFIMLFPILLNKEAWFKNDLSIKTNQNKILEPILLFLTGLYGGFIQAGVGIIFLTAMVSLLNYNLAFSNIVKNLIVFSFTIPALAIFIYYGHVNWWMGGMLACGQVAGAWVGASFAVKSNSSPKWIRRLLIIIIIVSVIELLGIRNLLY